MDKHRHNDAARTLAKGTGVLKALAAGEQDGVALTDVARQTGLPHPTVHRLLRQLIVERLATQDPHSRRYLLGPLAFELGLAAGRRFDMRAVCRAAVDRLGHETGDTIYVVVRSGAEAVCVDAREASSPIRVATLRVGSRRPLGVGAGGLAILAALSATEREIVIAQVTATVNPRWNVSERSLRANLDRVHANGYALIRDRVTPGVSAIGQPILDGLGQVHAAVSVAAITARMSKSRVAMVTSHLERARREIEAGLARA